MSARALLLAAALLAAPPLAPAGAQQSPLPAGGPPVEIVARDGIEWDRENMRYVARGAARVTQGDKTIEAETLTAFYRQPEGGGTEIYRYTATGSVRLTTATQRAFADNGVYDVTTGIVVLTGRSMRIVTPEQEITARESIEYWEQKRMAVARGDALVASRDGRRIAGDTLAAYFEDAPPAPAQGQARPAPQQRQQGASPLPGEPGSGQRLDRVEAFGNVIVTTPSEIAQGEKGVYNAKTGLALLTGAVKLTRGSSQANGDFLELNLNNGLYKLGCRPGTGSSCVRGLFVPDRQGEGTQRR
ncbi:MAG: LptA/OstA family protein [Alphaproteobacteria bacterium]